MALDLANMSISPTDRRGLDFSSGRLVGGRCANCDMRTWPVRSICPRCGLDAVERLQFGREGTLQSFSRVWVPVEGIQPPYDVGLIAVDGVQMFGHIRNARVELRAGVRVTIHVDAEERPPYWFEPVERSKAESDD